jgi:hypothetical protein
VRNLISTCFINFVLISVFILNNSIIKMFKKNTEYNNSLRGLGCNTNLSLVEILKETNKMIQNSTEYNSYMTKHNQFTTDPHKVKYVPLSSISLNLKSTHYRNSCNKFLNFSVGSDTFRQYLGMRNEKALKYEESMTALNNTGGTNENPINIFHTQSEILIEDNSYFDKVYDYNEIYRKDNYYAKMIINKIESLRSQRNENVTTMLNKQLGKENCIITLQSLEIRFINSEDLRAKPISVFLPFALLPLFYLVEAETFMLLLMLILKFNDSYTTIEIEEDMIYKALDSIDGYKTIDMEDIKSDNHNIHKLNWMTGKCIYDVYIR